MINATSVVAFAYDQLLEAQQREPDECIEN